jgi:hypothetical protein
MNGGFSIATFDYRRVKPPFLMSWIGMKPPSLKVAVRKIRWCRDTMCFLGVGASNFTNERNTHLFKDANRYYNYIKTIYAYHVLSDTFW